MLLALIIPELFSIDNFNYVNILKPPDIIYNGGKRQKLESNDINNFVDEQFLFDFALIKSSNAIQRNGQTFKTFSSISTIKSCVDINKCFFDNCFSELNAGAIDIRCNFHQITFSNSCFRQCSSRYNAGAIYTTSYAFVLYKICFDRCYSVLGDSNTILSKIYSNSTFYSISIKESFNHKSESYSLIDITAGGRQHNYNCINFTQNSNINTLMHTSAGIKVYVRNANFINNTISAYVHDNSESVMEFLIFNYNAINIESHTYILCPGICTISITSARFINSKFKMFTDANNSATIAIQESVSDYNYKIKGSILILDLIITEENAPLAVHTAEDMCHFSGIKGPILTISQAIFLCFGIILIVVLIAIAVILIRKRQLESREKKFFDDIYINQIIGDDNTD